MLGRVGISATGARDQAKLVVGRAWIVRANSKCPPQRWQGGGQLTTSYEHFGETGEIVTGGIEGGGTPKPRLGAFEVQLLLVEATPLHGDEIALPLWFPLLRPCQALRPVKGGRSFGVSSEGRECGGERDPSGR